MSARNDGGAAFPAYLKEGADFGHDFCQPGMSLRDYFAGQVVSGFMSQSHSGPKDWTDMGHGWGEDCANGLNKYESHIAATLAGFAYQVADAMLAAREKGGGE